MINSIMTSVQTLIVAALSEYTRVDAFYTPLKNVDSGDYPMAMVYDPAVRSVRLRERQREQTLIIAALFIRDHDESTQMRDDLDAVVDALEADPTLTATVEDVHATDWGSAEMQQAHTTGGMIIEVKLTS